jgi:hypothetical protein
LIALVRHGLSAHVHAGLVDLDGYQRWRDAYEAAGIDPREVPPSALQELAIRCGALVASDSPRASQSAQLLAPQREVVTSPLLRELELSPPNLRGIRLPLLGWAVAIGLRGALRRADATELARVRAAADWLVALADTHGDVVVVTHAMIRAKLADELQSRGMQRTVPRGRMRHRSAWELRRPL